MVRSWGATLRVGGIAALVVALLAGCGLGDRQRDADAIVDGTKAAFEVGTARGTVAIEAQIVEVPDALGSIGGVSLGGGELGAALPGQEQQLQGPPPIVADVVLDFEREVAALTMPGQDVPFAIYDGLETYGRRYNAGERDARPWVRLDLEDLEEGSSELSFTEDPPFLGGFALNPIVLFDLAAGPLAGSIEQLGTETIAGAPTSGYDANFDIEKVLRKTRRSRYDEDRREAIDEALNVLAVKGTTHAGQVWLDGDGIPRRFAITLREEPIKKLKIDLRITFELTELGGAADIAVPSPRERIEVDNLVQLLRSAVPAPGSPEFMTFLGIEPPAAPEAATP